jgi:hypothetical protein
MTLASVAGVYTARASGPGPELYCPCAPHVVAVQTVFAAQDFRPALCIARPDTTPPPSHNNPKTETPIRRIIFHLLQFADHDLIYYDSHFGMPGTCLANLVIVRLL